MGWSGGTEIFDCVVDALDNSLDIVYCPQHTDEAYMNLVLKPLLRVLEDQDWDTQNESTYWTHPIIGKILGNTLEEENNE